MTIRAYGAYRDSEVQWLGDVPGHWETVQVRRLFEIKKRISGEEGYDILSITQRGIKIRDTESNDGQVAMDYSKYQFVYPGDFAMNHMDLLTGYVDISSVFGVTSPDYRVFSARVTKSICQKYFLYLFQLCYQRKIFYAFGQGASQLGRWRLPTEQFNDFDLPLPPLAEQAAIAAFLDGETGKIDALVEAQRRLIELLREKRQAVISHAVTKGLDPTAPMMDSGVEWLGQVPAHWDVMPLKRAATVLPGFAFPSNGFSADARHVRLLRGVNVAVGSVRWDETVYWNRGADDGLDAFELHPGDVVLGMDRPWIGDGLRVATIDERDAPCLLLQRVAAVKPRPAHSGRYLRLLLDLPAFFHHCAPEMTGVSVPHISGSQVEEYVIATPPEAEQLAIAEHLQARTRIFDELITAAELAITLLQERRSALISAAVTGEIDVRGHVPAEAEAA